MTRFCEDDVRAQELLEQAEAAVGKLNRRLARLGGVRRYSVLAHTSARAQARRRKGESDGQAGQPAATA